MNTQKLLSSGGVAVAVASIAVGSLVFNDGNDSSASALGLSDGEVTQIALNYQATASEDREAYLQKIADNLGVDLARLKEAIASANLATLDEKVADGSITQERADAVRERLGTGDTFFFGGKGPGGPGFGRGGPGGFGAGVDSEALASFFGIDAATLRTELQTKSLATVAGEQGKSADELKAFLTSEKQSALAERVTAGDLTQEEADEKFADFQANLDEAINEVRTHGPRGPRPDGEEAPASPTTTAQ